MYVKTLISNENSVRNEMGGVSGEEEHDIVRGRI
jgi:hypothetical protein